MIVGVTKVQFTSRFVCTSRPALSVSRTLRVSSHGCASCLVILCISTWMRGLRVVFMSPNVRFTCDIYVPIRGLRIYVPMCGLRVICMSPCRRCKCPPLVGIMSQNVPFIYYTHLCVILLACLTHNSTGV